MIKQLARPLDYGEAQTYATLSFASWIVDLVILFENAGLVGGGDAYPRVLHDEVHSIAARLAQQRDDAPFRIFDGVGNEVSQNTLDPERVRANPLIGFSDL